MTATAFALPEKTRDIHNHHMDSTVWDKFKFHDDDIVIGTYASLALHGRSKSYPS